MKAFVCAIIIIILITGFAIFDFLYSKHYIEKIEKYVLSTPDSITEGDVTDELRDSVDKIDDLWKKYMKYLRATINYQQISNVSVAVDDFRNIALAGISQDYAKARDNLLSSLKNLRRFTIASFESIF